MVDKFFLALDYSSDSEIVDTGLRALDYLQTIYGQEFVQQRVGVKLNQDVLTGDIDPQFRKFKDENGCSIFADLKISHGYDTGVRIIERLKEHLPVDYVTVAANLGREMLNKYVDIGQRYNVGIIAFTVHTKISPEDASSIYLQSLNDAVYTLARIASKGGCHAVVLEGKMLEDERIRNLGIKKLVTGIRVDPEDKGTQKRVTSLEQLASIKPFVDYAVISSRYVGTLPDLKTVLDALL